jgi:uncharacterized OB-fold protein
VRQRLNARDDNSDDAAARAAAVSFLTSKSAGRSSILAVARLEEGPQMMANVVGIEPARMRVGLPVRVIVEERSEGFSVPQFAPVEESQ